MPFAAGIKFRQDAFSKYYDPSKLVLDVDDFCLVKDSDLNIERVGFVSCMEGRAPIQMDHLPKVIRTATDREVEQWYDLRIREKELRQTARECAESLDLPIKITEATRVEEEGKILIHFSSDKRVDFREMVKRLGVEFNSRIEMWQIGARKDAGIRGGIGLCGRGLCCSNWLKDFPSISMRHARDQDIIQLPSRLSGPCGRLRCCLRYEHEQYVQLRTGAPAVGCTGCSSAGACGIVIDRNLLKQEAVVRVEGGSVSVVPFAEFEVTAPAPPKRRGPKRPRKPSRASNGGSQ